MATHKYIKFVGDYSKLKSMGYEFQKLFAGNYMQWCKRSDGKFSSSTRIFKKGAEVCLDRLTNYEGSFFELYMDYKNNGKDLPWKSSSFMKTVYLRVVVNHTDYSASFDYDAYTAQEVANYAAFDNDNVDAMVDDLEVVSISKKHLAALDELIELGWAELATMETANNE